MFAFSTSAGRFAAALLGLGLLGAAATRASAQTQVSGNRGGTAGCGRADPAYISTANETGGIPMFLQRSEAGKAFQLVRESTRQNVATVLWATGTLKGAKTINIPVDSVTQRITFAFSVDTKGTELRLEQPSGAVIVPGSGGAEVTELNCGRIVTVSSPRAGNWRAHVSGSGHFWLEAQAQSDIYFIGSEFVHLGGRPGHEGLFRIAGQPVAGKPATLKVSLSAQGTRSAHFFLVGEDGERIQTLRLRRANSDREFLEFAGEIELPGKPFRVAVYGNDAHGNPYQRFFAGLYHAETVEVSAVREFDDVTPASVAEAKFTVRNIGAPRTFKITVTDTRGFVSNVEPRELPLGADESGTVRVQLKIPAVPPTDAEDDVVIVAASTTGPPTSNSSVAHLSVAFPSR